MGDSRLGEDRRHQQTFSQHILRIQVSAGHIVRELQQHRTHDRQTFLHRLHRLCPDIGHQRLLEKGKLPTDFHGLLAVQPRHFILFAGMVPAMRRKQSKLRPAHIHIRRTMVIFESPHIMAPKTESRQHERQSAAQRLCHGAIRGLAVSTPVYRIFLPARGRRSCEDNRVLFSFFFTDHLIGRLVIQQRIIIVHSFRIRSIVIHHVLPGNPLAEIRLKAVHAHPEQSAKLLLIPFSGFWMRKVHDPHAGLPHVGLPYTAILTAKQVSLRSRLLKERRFLRNIRIDPYTHANSSVMNGPQHPFRIREAVFPPLEITPFKLLHPAAVEMENLHGNPVLRHPIQKTHDGLLIVFCHKRSREPKSKGPSGRQSRHPRQRRIILQYTLIRIGVSPCADHAI